MNSDEPCTDMSVQCTNHAHTCTYKLKHIFHALSFVQTRYTHVHFVFASMIVYILVQSLFKQCIYQVYTLNVQVQDFMYIEYKSKMLPRSGSNSQPYADSLAALTIVLAALLLSMP